MAVSISQGGLSFEATIDVTQFQAQLRQMERQLNSIATTANYNSQQIENFAKRTSAAIATYVSLTTASELVSNIVKVRAEFQKIEAVLTNSFGSKSEAAKSLDMISDFAATTPFQLSELSGAFVKLVNQGFKPTREEMTQLGDLAASTGKGFDQLAEAIIDAQTGEFERLKEFGIRAEKAGDQVKFSFKGVQTQVAFTSDAIRNYITGLGNLQGVAGATAAISKTLGGQLSNLADSWDRMLNKIGQDNEGVFADAIGVASDLVENYQEVLDIIGLLIITYGSYKAALIATSVIERSSLAIREQMAVQNALAIKQNIALTTTQKLGAAASITWQRAQMGLNAALLSNAPGIALAGIAALVAGLTILRDKTFEVKSATERFNDAQKEAVGNFSEQEAEIRQYVDTLNNQNIAESTRLEAYNKLKQIAPEIIGQLSFQESKTKDLTLATNNYLVALRKRITLEALQSQYSEALKKKQETIDAAKPFIGKDGKAKDGGFFDVLNPFSESSFSNSEGELRIKSAQKAADVVVDIEKQIQQTLGQSTQDGIKFRIQQLQQEQSFLDKRSAAYKKNEEELSRLQKSLVDNTKAATKSLQDLLKESNFKNVFTDALGLATNKTDLDSIKKKLQSELDAINPNATDFHKQASAYQSLISEVQNRINQYDTKKVQAENSKAAKSFEELQNKIKSLTDERSGILEDINALGRDAKQSGLIKEQSELDKVNEKYQNQLLIIDKINQKIKEFNNKNKTSVAQITPAQIEQVKRFRDVELSNTEQKQQAANYIKSLDDQKRIFERYEQSKKEIGIEKANELYREQTKGFQSYIAFLQKEAAKVAIPIAMGVGGIGDVLKAGALAKEIKDTRDRQADTDLQDSSKLIQSLLTFREREKLINERYAQQEKLLNDANAKGVIANYQEVYDTLQKMRTNDLDQLKNDLIRSSELYQRLGKDVISFSGDQLKQEIKNLQDKLKSSANLTPEMRAAIESRINQLISLFASTDKITQKALRTADSFNAVGSGLSNLGSALSGVNDELAQTLSMLGNISTFIGSVVTNLEAIKVARLKKNDIAGELTGAFGIMGAAVSVFTMIDGFFRKAKAERREARAEAEAFRLQVLSGEQEITQEYRARAREQAHINELRIEGIKQEMQLLNQQKDIIDRDAARILAQLQTQARLAETDAEKTIQARDRVLGSNSAIFSLAGKSFEDLEQFYKKGLLEGQAKALFEQLQKLKDEGADVNKLIEDAKQKAKEIFTGTTTDSLIDSIAQMFKEGKTSAQDFADFFQETMQDAALSIFKSKEIAKQMEAFFEQFAAAAESGDALTAPEIEELKKVFNSSMEDLNKKFEQLRQITGIDLSAGTNNASNSLAGAIKGITEQQAELLAAQFGGLRLATLEVQRLNSQMLSELTSIQNNTGLTAQRLLTVANKMDYYFRDIGIKVQ